MQQSAERQEEKSRSLLIFAERLKSRRHRLNLSQIELAEKADVSPRSIVAWESGNLNLPRGLELGRLIKALEVDIAWLLGNEDTKKFIEDRDMMNRSPATSLHSFAETPTLEKILGELVARLSKCAPHERKHIIGNMADLVGELEQREISSKPLSEAQQIVSDSAAGKVKKHS